MINQSLPHWIPTLLVLLASILFVSWAVDQEAHIQGSAFLPGGTLFHAYLPGRYAMYCDMDVLPEHEAMRLKDMKALPRIICEIRGAGYLNVLSVDSWHSGGLSRYIRASNNSIRLLIPFAECDILWPGNYEVRATFIGQGPKTFLMSVGPTSLVAISLFISIIALITTLFLTLWRNKKMRIAEVAENGVSESSITEVEAVKNE